MNTRGFTLIELVVCVAIFAMMTSLLVAKYGTFNQSVLLTDLAYDTAITIRTAQTYGLSVQSSNVGTTPFNYAYGVDFSTAAPANILTLFADTYGPATLPWSGSPDGAYESGAGKDSLVSAYTITRGAIISAMCVSDGSDCNTGTLKASPNVVDITFKRPNPDAVICINGIGTPCPYAYAQITIKGTDGSTRQVIIRNTGQVSVQE